jgi:hypothetical protein
VSFGDLSSATEASLALRRAGFVKVPKGLWVTQDQLDLILYLASQNLPTINHIKETCHDPRRP